MITFSQHRDLVRSDLWRYAGGSSLVQFVYHYLFTEGFRYSFWMRTCLLLEGRRSLYPVYILARLVLVRLGHKYGISVSHRTRIGAGFYIGHFGCIVVHPKAIIGLNCNISHGVTIGQSNRGEKEGVPALGDNVYVGPGAKIFGAVSIGNNVAVGANCVVVDDLPPSAVAVGVPARIASYKGSEGYVQRTSYPHIVQEM